MARLHPTRWPSALPHTLTIRLQRQGSRSELFPTRGRVSTRQSGQDLTRVSTNLVYASVFITTSNPVVGACRFMNAKRYICRLTTEWTAAPLAEDCESCSILASVLTPPSSGHVSTFQHLSAGYRVRQGRRKPAWGAAYVDVLSTDRRLPCAVARHRHMRRWSFGCPRDPRDQARRSLGRLWWIGDRACRVAQPNARKCAPLLAPAGFSQEIGRAAYAHPSLVEDVGVDHGRLDATVAQ